MAKKVNKQDRAIIKETQTLIPNVTIKVKEGKHILKTVKVHNQATQRLLYGLLLALGNYNNQYNVSEYLPRYIGVGKGSIDTIFTSDKLGTETTILRTEIITNFKGGPQIGSDKVSVVYQGTLPYENITVSTEGIKEIGLFSTLTGSSLIAAVNLTTPLILEQGQTLVVEWEFILKNAR